MGHYKSNVRDLEFNLFEVFGRREILGTGPFAEVDEDTARTVLDEVNRLATGPLAASFEDADRHPPVFDPVTHSVTMPESFKRSYQAWVDAEWWRLELQPELGGTPAPRSLVWAMAEMVLGANPAVWMFACGPAFARLLFELGTPSRSGSPSWPSSGTGARPWCSPSPTPAPTWARAVRRRSSNPTAPGTSRASSASSPVPSTT